MEFNRFLFGVPAPINFFLLSAFCFLLSAFCFLLSAFCFLLSAFCFLLSAFCFLLSAFAVTSPKITTYVTHN
ncbi:hypothetical protein FUA23_01745 [Neolewinella aurantiaca]|uniref:Uncharacterized protein n=1 Tax=Neolewinella aurantiaca TaxID=2602767 RepID=A0A5C7G0C4_9BACT|nr:hypothetical protein FUA23_01745 [Neolewinella aurantiaca]